MKSLLYLILFCAFYGLPQTQAQWVLRGQIVDHESRQGLAYASVVLLNSLDSNLIANVHTESKGNFMITSHVPGRHILQIRYLAYEPLTLHLSLDTGQKITDLGILLLQRTQLTLNTIEIREKKLPLEIKKDTIEYNASSFKTRENDILEELLKKLPGVQVKKDGTLSFNGQQITKLLVDGVPFFGGDPKMALKNLPADLIDKIQLLNQKPEFKELGDKVPEKVINLTVKPKMKKGIFGRNSAGYGTNRRFAGNAGLNRFNNNEQISFAGAGSNVNDPLFIENGRNTKKEENGINQVWNAGVNYNRKLGKTAKVYGNYMFDANKTTSNQNSTRLNLLPDTTYYYNQNIHCLDKTTKHNISNRFEYKPDSLYSFTVAAGLSSVNVNNRSDNKYESLNEQLNQTNYGFIRNTNVEGYREVYVTTFAERKFNKKGRMLNSIFSISNRNDNEKLYNENNTLFKKEDGNVLLDSLNQFNNISATNKRVMLFLAYTEPILKNHFVELGGNYTGNQSYSERHTFDYNKTTGQYNQKNDKMSNSFENNVNFYFSHIRLTGTFEKLNYGVCINVVLTTTNNENISLRSTNQKKTFNIYPDVYLQAILSKGKRLTFNYSAYLLPPTIEQLQPIINNNNPLYYQVGNPNLKMALGHNTQIRYEAFSQKTLRSFYVGINATLMNNNVVYATQIDSLGRQITQPVNANGIYNIKGSIANSIPLRSANTTINSTIELNSSNDVNFTNGIKVTTYNHNISQILNCTYSHKELLDIDFSASAHYNAVISSVQKENNTKYFTYEFSLNGRLNLPVGFISGFNLDYQLNSGLAAGYNMNITLMNVFIAKTLLRGKQGVIKLHVFDLLNQNKSTNRIIGKNYIEDQQNNVLRQFFMFSFTYYFKQASAKKTS